MCELSIQGMSLARRGKERLESLRQDTQHEQHKRSRGRREGINYSHHYILLPEISNVIITARSASTELPRPIHDRLAF